MIEVSLAILTGCVLLITLQLARAKDFGTRVVILDLLSVVAVGFLLVIAFATEHRVIIDAALVLALIAFLSTAALGLFLGGRRRGE